MIHVSSRFHGGNIEVDSADRADDIRLSIRRDEGGRHCQWFSFRVANARDTELTMVIGNAGEVSYPEGFRDYRAVASHDGEFWFRVPTEFDGSRLTIRHRPETDLVHYAYFAPYDEGREAALIAEALDSPLVRGQTLCHTPDGRGLMLLSIGGGGAERRNLWITARQHPGETMAEWWVEGFLERLLDPEDPVARRVLEMATIHLVPNMNPDGSARGHLRVNARGVNLNRAWKDPSEADSPEVFSVRRRMHETGVDFALDVHGDEALPYNFIAGGEGVPRFNDAMEAELVRFKSLLEAISPDFQTGHGYERDAPGSADLRKCTDYIAETFGCLAMTLEMPFKDTADTPLPAIGWSPGRCRRLGAACLDAMYRWLVEKA